MILVAVEDLIFLSKIRQTAQLIGVEAVASGQIRDRLTQSPARAVIMDLNNRSGSPVEAIRALKASATTKHARLAGFLSHVQADLATAAREAGCDVVMARSTFTQLLPYLLRQLTGMDEQPHKG